MAGRMIRLKTNEVIELADELFKLVEYDQGKGFISDGLNALPNKTIFFDVVRGHLRHSELAVKKIKRFLRRHNELGY